MLIFTTLYKYNMKINWMVVLTNVDFLLDKLVKLKKD